MKYQFELSFAFPIGLWSLLSIMPRLLLALALVLAGCTSMQSGTNRTLKQTQLDVSWPTTGYRNAAYFGSLTLGEKQRMNAAYAAYQSAFDQALQEAGGNYDTPAPDYLKARANKLLEVQAGIPLGP